MVRLILFLLTVTALSLGLAWIADQPGHVVIDWADYRIETSLLVLLATIALLALWCIVAYTLLYMIIHSPRLWKRSRLAKRQALGLEALTEAFAAIATQDIPTAKKQVARAQQYMPHQPLTLMLAAQVARHEGNESQSRLYLEQMLKAEGTEFMALRGLIETARRNNDDKAALAYAEKALTVKPHDAWLITTLTGLYTRQGQSQNAIRLLELSARKGYIGKKEARELSAHALYENALALKAQGRLEFAITVLEDVLRKLPGFAPAGALLAQAYLKQGDIKHALKTAGGVWKIAPHPAIAEVLLECYDAGKERDKVVHTLEKLAGAHTEHRESQFLLAGLALKTHDYDSARNYIKHLLQVKETARALTLMATLHTATGNHDKAAEWLKRAGSAVSEE